MQTLSEFAVQLTVPPAILISLISLLLACISAMQQLYKWGELIYPPSLCDISILIILNVALVCGRGLCEFSFWLFDIHQLHASGEFVEQTFESFRAKPQLAISV